ncbi:MAG: TolC family protein [Acidobacteriota bacterium]
MNRRVWMMVSLLLALAAAPAWWAAEPLTLRQAMARALAANPKLQAAKLETVAASQRTKEAVGRHFGELDLVAGYDQFEHARPLIPISEELLGPKGIAGLPWAQNQRRYGISYEIPLLASGGLHEGLKIAKLSQNASEAVALFTRDEVRYNVRAAYRNALVAEHAFEAVRAYRTFLEKDKADADLKVKVGTWAPVDGAKVDFALENAKALEAAAEGHVKIAEATLAALMGEDPPADGYELSDETALPPVPADSQARLLNQALTGRQDLVATLRATQIAERKKRLAMEAFGPQLELAGTYLRNDSPAVPGELRSHDFGIYLKIPVFKGFTRIAALQEENANLLVAKQRERAKRLEVATQVVEAESRLTAAQAALKAGEAQRSLGAEVARVEHLKLEQGTGKMEDYLAARAEQLQGETAYWQGLYGLQSAVDYLDFVCARGGEHE